MVYLNRIAGTLFLIFSFIPNYFGQTLELMEIRGMVIDSTNEQPLSFALIRIKNKSLASTTNIEGNFSISFPQLVDQDSLVISMIGYSSQTIAIKDLSRHEINTFQMVESVFQLEEVEVTFPDVEKLVKEVSKRIKTTFPSESIDFEGYYRKAYREFGVFVKQYEVAISGFDDQYHKRNGFTVSRLKEKESKDFRKNKWRQSEGNVPWHYLWHVRRQHIHFFDSDSFKSYDYSLGDIIIDNGERIYKIDIKLKENSEREANSWAFVRESDFAILEIGGETTIINPKMFQLSDSLKMDYIGGNVLVKYLDYGGRMYPAYSRSSYNHRVYNEKSEFLGIAEMNEELFILEVNTPSQFGNKNDFVQDQQQRINELPSDSIFWAIFNAPLETALSKAIKQDIAGFEKISPKNGIENGDRKSLIPTESLEKDFDLFRYGLEEAHPSLYRFTSKDELDSQFESTRLKLNRPMGEPEFFGLLTPVLAKIRCGHTKGFMPKSFNNANNHENVTLPIQVKFISGMLYIWKVLSPEIPNLEGMEITAINDIEIAEIIDRIYPHLIGDGFIETSKVKDLEENFTHYYEQIVGPSERFEITLKNLNGDIQKLTLSAISHATHTKYKGKSSNDNDFRMLSEQIGFLKIGTFMDSEVIDFEPWLENAFLEINENNVSDLIIDLRDNGGGNDLYAIKLLKYLVDEPFSFHRSLRSSTDQYTFLSYTEEGESLNSIMSQIVNKDSSGNFSLQDSHPTLGLKSPYSDVYQGKIYFLINGKTFSTAADFAALAREYQLGVFVGEETGGTFEGNTSNGEILLNLPHSKIRIVIPLFQIQNAVSQTPVKGRGIISDIKVNYTMEDYIRIKDLEIEIAMTLINDK